MIVAAIVLAAVPSWVRIAGHEVKRYGTDAVAMARAPLTWDAAMWQRAAMVAGADGTAFAADQEIADAVQRNRNHATNEFARIVTPFGGRRALDISAAALLAGAIAHRTGLRATGRDAVEASILASGIVTPVLKRAAGRSRPIANEGAYAFDPFSNNESWPSGHATNAFAVASVFAAHAKGWIVPTIAYTLATGVAVSRMNDNVHYASDVIAGAAIGTAVGRSIVARHRLDAEHAPPRVSWMIMPMQHGVGIQINIHRF